MAQSKYSHVPSIHFCRPPATPSDRVNPLPEFPPSPQMPLTPRPRPRPRSAQRQLTFTDLSATAYMV